MHLICYHTHNKVYYDKIINVYLLFYKHKHLISVSNLDPQSNLINSIVSLCSANVNEVRQLCGSVYVIYLDMIAGALEG